HGRYALAGDASDHIHGDKCSQYSHDNGCKYRRDPPVDHGKEKEYDTYKGKDKGNGGMKALLPADHAEGDQEQKYDRIQHPGAVITVDRNIERVITFVYLGNDSHSWFTVSSVEIARRAHCFHCISFIISA